MTVPDEQVLDALDRAEQRCLLALTLQGLARNPWVETLPRAEMVSLLLDRFDADELDGIDPEDVRETNREFVRAYTVERPTPNGREYQEHLDEWDIELSEERVEELEQLVPSR